MQREEMIDQLNDKLHAWDARLERLEHDAAAKKAELKGRYAEERTQLREKRADLRTRLQLSLIHI